MFETGIRQPRRLVVATFKMLEKWKAVACTHVRKPPYSRAPLFPISATTSLYIQESHLHQDDDEGKVYAWAIWARNVSLLSWHKSLFLFFSPSPFAESVWQGRGALVLTNQVPIRGKSTNDKQGFHKNTISRWCPLFAENPNYNHRNQHRRKTQFAKTTRPGSAILQCNSTITKARRSNV